MTKRGKANNRINIVSFHPHVWFSIQSNLFRSDAEPKGESGTRVLQEVPFGMKAFAFLVPLHAVAISKTK